MNAPAWDEILAAAESAPYPVEILPPDANRADACLTRLGITTNSWLGAAIAHTGGILVDHGWLRVLASGSGDLPDILVQADQSSQWLTVAYDVLGGQYAWTPHTPGAPPTIHYFAPDDLDWLDLQQGYADWLYAVLSGSLTQFYETLRWPTWKTEVAALSLHEGIHTWPPPSTVEGQDISQTSRKAVPMPELITFHHDMARQLG